MSTSTQSNSASPIGVYSQNGAHITIPPLEQASDSSHTEQLPSASLVVQNLLTRVNHEIKENVDTVLPRLNGIHQMKRTFRDIFIKETTHVFDFLDKPIGKNTTLVKATEIMKRFGRSDFNIKKSGLRDLCIHIDCHDVLDSLQISLQILGQNSDPLAQWVLQTRQILEQWRLATNQLTTAEKQLEFHCTIFDNILTKAKTVLDLPSDIYETSVESSPYKKLLIATEEYIQKMFHDNNIEESFHEYCRILKKVTLLTDAMNTIRTWVNVSNEPLCSICITEPISVAYVPCGHTFCKGCGQRQSLSCHVCRTPIREKQKLYFS